MEFRQLKTSLADTKADLIVCAVFGDPLRDATFKLADSAAGGLLKTIAKEQEFTGKETQSMVARTSDGLAAKNIAILGLGKREAFTIPKLRDHGARAAAIGQRLGAKSLAVVLPDVG
ncbi:MAG: M17 family peptidase N-terminal domain-containing protein, partial [Myxococcota bacterium]